MSFILRVSPLRSVIIITWPYVLHEGSKHVTCFPTMTQIGGGLLKVTLQAVEQEGKQPMGFLLSHVH